MSNTANAAWFTRLVALSVVVVGALYGCNALLRPVIARYQGLNRTAKCASNMHFLVRSCSVYSEDYDGCFPLATGWMDHIGPYATKPQWIRCPEVVERQPERVWLRAECGDRGAWTATVCRSPRRRPVAYDSQRLERSAVDRLESLPKPGRHESRTQSGQSLRGNLVGYADGRARFIQDGRPVAGK